MADHTETVQVEFDPQQIAYLELLQLFWDWHNPAYNSSNRQYRNAIFFLNQDQRQQAEKLREQIARKLGKPVQTDIEPATPFYPAEDYHQKYYLRKNDALLAEFKSIYPSAKLLAASTAAARVNGYLGCFGSPEQLAEEIGRLGLSVAAQQQLVKHLGSLCNGFEGVTCPVPQ